MHSAAAEWMGRGRARSCKELPAAMGEESRGFKVDPGAPERTWDAGRGSGRGECLAGKASGEGP